MNLLIALTALVAVVTVVHGGVTEDEYRLRRLIGESYDDIRRDMVPGNRPVTVTVGMTLVDIMTLDEETGIITVRGWNSMEWDDDNLRWDPNEFNGITKLHLDSSSIWKPDLLLYNDVSFTKNQDMSVKALATNTGRVFLIPPAVFSVTCARAQGEQEWECPFKFGSWVYDGTYVNLEVSQPTIDVSTYTQNRNYEVVTTDAELHTMTYACCPEPYQDVTFTMRLRRRRGETPAGK